MKKILAPGRNCRGIYRVGTTGLLVDGRNYYRAFYDAARQARRYILIAGWQFERSMRLLRGHEETAAPGDVRMAPFLNGLCEKNPELQIFILMWDFSPIVAFDKEWFNKLVLDLTTSDRIHFRFDSSHALGASHHQKLVVIDGYIAFVGGLDLSANGWDDRKHWAENAERVLAGEQYEAYHDVQSYHTGPVAWELTKLFVERWFQSSGEKLSFAPAHYSVGPRIRRLIPIRARTVAVNVTRAQTLLPMLQPVKDIRQLYCDAIAAADKVIYMENQYFSSQAVYQALKERMTERSRPKPQIVLILPKRLHTFIEDISLSVVQAKMLRSLTEIAGSNDQPFGVYYSTAVSSHGDVERSTYIHSKVLLVDDYFLTIGSANITNRSMGMDTELNVSWEAVPQDQDLIRSIRRFRGNLLAEHTGLRKLSQRRTLNRQSGLVEYLNSVADREGCRLRRHTMESFLEDVSWIKDLMPEDLSIDPESPVIEETINEFISREKDSVFAKGLLFLNELAKPQPPGQLERKTSELEVAETAPLSRPVHVRFRWRLIAVVSLIIAAVIFLLWLLFRA